MHTCAHTHRYTYVSDWVTWGLSVQARGKACFFKVRSDMSNWAPGFQGQYVGTLQGIYHSFFLLHAKKKEVTEPHLWLTCIWYTALLYGALSFFLPKSGISAAWHREKMVHQCPSTWYGRKSGLAFLHSGSECPWLACLPALRALLPPLLIHYCWLSGTSKWGLLLCLPGWRWSNGPHNLKVRWKGR